MLKNKVQIPLLLLLIALLSISEASAKKKQPYSVIDTITLNNMDKKKFDIELYEKLLEQRSPRDKTSDVRYTKEDGAEIRVSKKENYYVEHETPPAPKLYQIEREYHLNGNLKKECFELRRAPIGVQKEYDEFGNLIKEIDHDKTYGKFDYNQVILFLDKKGHIDIKTGKGREDLGIGYNEEKKMWDITIWASENNAWFGYFYYLDGNSGKVKKSGRVRLE